MQQSGDVTLRTFLGIENGPKGDAEGTLWVESTAGTAATANERAAAICEALTRVLNRLALPGFVYLATFEMDLDAGRFPSLLDAFFADAHWDYDTRFYVREMKHASKTDAIMSGLLSAEGDAGFAERMLRLESGFRWAANMRVEGVQVPDGLVSTLIERLPLNGPTIAEFGGEIRVAFRLSQSLDELHLFTRPGLSAS